MAKSNIFIFAVFFSVVCMSLSAEVTIAFGDKPEQAAFINQNNNPGIEEPLPLGPLSFQVTSKFIYIADSVGGKIIAADKETGAVTALKLTDKPKDMLFDDLAVVADKNGKARFFWVIDALSNSLLQFADDGKLLGKISSEKMIQPYRLEISNSGLLFVADKGARSIFAFDQQGKLIVEMPWEWSGMALSPDSDIVYRLFFAPESGTSFLVSANVEGKLTMERELDLGEHFNTELWWVDEEKQECVITFATAQNYQASLILARVGFDGKIKSKKDFKVPFAMNRFIDNYGTEIWAGVGDFSKAPEGNFSLVKFDLP
jgi:hypothetical protein